MTDTLNIELDMEAADQIVVSWLKANIEIIKSSRGNFPHDKLEDDEDYKALLRVYEYVAGEEYD